MDHQPKSNLNKKFFKAHQTAILRFFRPRQSRFLWTFCCEVHCDNVGMSSWFEWSQSAMTTTIAVQALSPVIKGSKKHHEFCLTISAGYSLTPPSSFRESNQVPIISQTSFSQKFQKPMILSWQMIKSASHQNYGHCVDDEFPVVHHAITLQGKFSHHFNSN